MGVVTSLLFFLVINFLGMKYALGKRVYTLQASVGPEKTWQFSHGEMFILLTVACAPLAAAPLGALAVRLLGWLILCGFGLFVLTKPFMITRVTFCYILYLLWLFISLLLTPHPAYGIRVLMKYLLPFLLLLYVPRAVTTPHLFEKAIKYTFTIFCIVIGYLLLSSIGLGKILNFIFGGVVWWPPAILDSYGVVLSVCIVCAKTFHQKKYYWLLFPALLVPLIGYVVRTGLIVFMVTAIAIVLFHYKWKAIPAVILLAAISIASIVYVPKIREKMFIQEISSEYLLEHYQEMSFEDINSNGRYYMWDVLLSNFYKPSPVTGSGLGTTQRAMYEELSPLFGGLEVPHNDYVQILCDTGQIGLFLYALVLLSMIFHSFSLYNNHKNSKESRYAALIGGTSICGMAAGMMTDNVVNYTMSTIVYPFIFYALAIGLKKLEETKQNENTVQCHHSAV